MIKYDTVRVVKSPLTMIFLCEICRSNFLNGDSVYITRKYKVTTLSYVDAEGTSLLHWQIVMEKLTCENPECIMAAKVLCL